MDSEKAILTGGIPLCPYCKEPTKRQGAVGDTTTCPVNSYKNKQTLHWQCLKCEQYYVTTGNSIDGHYYQNLES